LQVKFHKPEGLDTLTQDKYKQVNEDILAGIGVSRVLLDGQGANFSTAWVSILSLIERLENARAKIGRWLEGEYRRIAIENGFKTYPRVRFNKMNLREDTYIRDVLLAMYDRGLIDEEDILTETGRDYESIIDMKKRNEKNKDLFLPPEQPFQGGQAGPNGGGRSPGTGGTYKKRTTSPEQNSGKAPKAKKSSASVAQTASYDSLQEDYEKELSDYYDMVQSEVQRVVNENKDEDKTLLHAMILATIMTMFKSISKLGDKTINDIFNDTASEYYDNMANSRLQQARKELYDWNSSYVSKLANDVRTEVKANLDNYDSIDKALSQAFDSNRYRVKLIAEAGVIESVRQAKIQGNALAGNSYATWIAHIDDRTCNTCKGLHGQQFNIDDIPPRPHSSCRCDLEFN
jgi:SPP1 gp7 family putative phage head morphogenesis protein